MKPLCFRHNRIKYSSSDHLSTVLGAISIIILVENRKEFKRIKMGFGMYMQKLRRPKSAGLVLPISTVHKNLKRGRYAKIITSPASVYLTSVLEYLVLEMMEGAGDVLKSDTKRRKRIYPRHIMLAVSSDQELQKLLENVTLPSTGRVSYINPVLLPLRTPLRKSSKK